MDELHIAMSFQACKEKKLEEETHHIPPNAILINKKSSELKVLNWKGESGGNWRAKVS
jgi:hypothetical protein